MSNHSVKADVNQLIQAALKAVDPAQAVRRHVRREADILYIDQASYDLRSFDEIRLVAVGKAAAPMALACRELIDDRLRSGVIVTKYGHLGSLATLSDPRLSVIESAHPVPDENSRRGGEQVTQLVTGCTPRTLVLACISGGASALMVAPHPGIRLSTMQAINDALLRSGADIREMNIVRARLDQLKGGGLARRCAPGQIIGLILSDVIGDPLDVIASGLTNDPRAANTLVANNTQACQAVADAARALGYAPTIVTTELRGEARERGQEIAQAICTAPPHTCLIYGGETTVTLRGHGKGGRNQELALAAVLALGQPSTGHVLVASFGTDGTDGPTDAAGALALPDTLTRAATLGLDGSDYLARNDSYHFFQPLGDLLITGPTGTNVADVVVALHE
jgi:hydroxypyruvate reductase